MERQPHHFRLACLGLDGNEIYFNDGDEEDAGAKTIRIPFSKDEKMALKYIRNPKLYEQEVEILKSLAPLKLRNVCRALGFNPDDQTIVFRRYEKDLFHLFTDDGAKAALTKEIRRQLLYDISAALRHLHRNGYSHRDVKPENILVNPDPKKSGFYEVSLCDFGLSSVSKRCIKGKDNCVGTAAWIAPEIIHLPEYDIASTDWWSFGLIAFLVMSNYPLYCDRDPKKQVNRDLFHREIYQRGWASRWARYPFEFTRSEKELVEGCLSFNLSKRASAETIQSFRYFTEELEA